MAYSYDYFVAHLRCPVCKNMSSADDSTEMYTYIRENSNAEFLRVGFSLYFPLEAIENNTTDGYHKIKTPELGESIHLLHPWRCPKCAIYNWVEIVLQDSIIATISNVSLDRSTLKRSHLISKDVDFVVEDWSSLSANNQNS